MPQVFIRHPLTGQPVILTKGAIRPIRLPNLPLNLFDCYAKSTYPKRSWKSLVFASRL